MVGFVVSVGIDVGVAVSVGVAVGLATSVEVAVGMVVSVRIIVGVIVSAASTSGGVPGKHPVSSNNIATNFQVDILIFRNIIFPLLWEVALQSAAGEHHAELDRGCTNMFMQITSDGHASEFFEDVN
jgi:hypothetical protein